MELELPIHCSFDRARGGPKLGLHHFWPGPFEVQMVPQHRHDFERFRVFREAHARPTLDCTRLLRHGHAAMLALSAGWIIKDAWWSIELLAHVSRDDQRLPGTTSCFSCALPQLHSKTQNTGRRSQSKGLQELLGPGTKVRLWPRGSRSLRCSRTPLRSSCCARA